MSGETEGSGTVDGGLVDGQSHTLMAELLLTAPAAIDSDRLLADVRRVLPGTELAGDGPAGPMLAHHDHEHTFADGKRVPILSVVVRPDGDGAGPALTAERDLSQTPDPPAAAALVARCPTSLAVAEMMGRVHDPAARVAAFRATLLALVDQTEPAAVWLPHSTSLVDPQELRRHDLAGLINVRIFRIENDPGAVVMDTLGLHVLGLPDLQCHFKGLDPNAMAGMLYDTAAYLYNHGDVIDDGHTLGRIDGEAWRCQHEDALVPPHRLVLDLDPGDPHAAGTRHR